MGHPILEKLTKWRNVFASWQLGTRDKEDPENQAVKDHRELTILLRAEMNAVTKLLLDKGAFTAEEFTLQVLEEALHLDKQYEAQFPGFSTSELGVYIKLPEALETTRNWRP